MDELKKSAGITPTDSRTASLVEVNRETGQKREFEICDLHQKVD